MNEFGEMLHDLLHQMNTPRVRVPKQLKCPVCNEEFPYSQSTGRGKLEDRLSHSGRLIYITNGSCPVCMEDDIGPTMVSLECGHLVCREDFVRLGGKMGEPAMMTVEQADNYDLENDSDNEEELLETAERAAFEQFRELLMGNGIEYIGSSGIEYIGSNGQSNIAEFLAQVAGRQGGVAVPYADGDDSDSESDDETMPELIAREVDNNLHSESDDDSMPGLNARQMNSNSDSESDDDSMPELLSRDTQR